MTDPYYTTSLQEGWTIRAGDDDRRPPAARVRSKVDGEFMDVIRDETRRRRPQPPPLTAEPRPGRTPFVPAEFFKRAGIPAEPPPRDMRVPVERRNPKPGFVVAATLPARVRYAVEQARANGAQARLEGNTGRRINEPYRGSRPVEFLPRDERDPATRTVAKVTEQPAHRRRRLGIGAD